MQIVTPYKKRSSSSIPAKLEGLETKSFTNKQNDGLNKAAQGSKQGTHIQAGQLGVWVMCSTWSSEAFNDL